MLHDDATQSTSDAAGTIAGPHPLDPLTGPEITAACRLAMTAAAIGDEARFPWILHEEPTKAEVLAFRPGDTIDRRVRVVMLDRASGATYDAVVSVTDHRVLSLDRVPSQEAPYGQPPIMLEEVILVGEIAKADPRWRAAVRARGVEDIDLVQVDPFTAGQFGFGEERGRRIVAATAFARRAPTDNAYAHPLDGLIAYVDVIERRIVRLVDAGVLPVPQADGRYDAESVGPLRTTLKPLDIVQPDGPSFRVDGNLVEWEKWRFRVSLDAREGLVLHTVTYDVDGHARSILYRASIAEMIVPYGDPSPGHYWKSAFDAGEYGLGKLTSSLELGCDCLGVIHYFDAVLGDETGRPITIPQAICMHEEDYGILWRHHELRDGTREVRRSRRLVISFFATVGNYDYGVFWYLYQDGTIQCEVKLTGILQTGARHLAEDELQFGRVVAPGLSAPIHQHLFCARLDLDVDGEANTVYEVDACRVPRGARNQHGTAFAVRAVPLCDEASAQRLADSSVSRYWTVCSTSSRNAVGAPVAYKLVPQGTAPLLCDTDSPVTRRAGFASKHLWVTRFDPGERYPAGPYPNQHEGGDGLPEWTRANRSIRDTDIVLWHVFGTTHVPRPEDWPVMPVEYAGFTLKPDGFFDRNPALDLPPTVKRCSHHGPGSKTTRDHFGKEPT